MSITQWFPLDKTTHLFFSLGTFKIWLHSRRSMTAWGVVMLSVVFFYCCAKYDYAECRGAPAMAWTRRPGANGRHWRLFDDADKVPLDYLITFLVRTKNTLAYSPQRRRRRKKVFCDVDVRSAANVPFWRRFRGRHTKSDRRSGWHRRRRRNVENDDIDVCHDQRRVGVEL